MLTYLNPGDRNLHRFSDKWLWAQIRSYHSLISQWKFRASGEITGRSCSLRRERVSLRDAEVELGLPSICPFHRFIKRRQVLCRGLSQSQWMEMSRHVLSISGRCFFVLNLEKPLWGCMSASSRRRDDQAFSPLSPFNDIIFHMQLFLRKHKTIKGQQLILDLKIGHLTCACVVVNNPQLSWQLRNSAIFWALVHSA